jgi:hypothetical protein
VHPAAIDLTKEFKPYALELLLHLLLLWLAFSFLRSPATRSVALVSLAATVAAPFSWSIVVLYPGVFTAMAVSALRRRSLPELLGALGGGAVTLGAVLLAYLSQQQGTDPNAAYWGEKYDIFYMGSSLPGQLRWLVDKTYEVASFPARLEAFWFGGRVDEVFAAAQVVCCLVGVIAIGAARRWDWAGLWLSPWAVTVGLNLLGLWPYGVFRTNLFLLAYALPVALAGLDGMRRWIASRPGLPKAARLAVPVYLSSFTLAFLPVDISFFAQGKGSRMAGNCRVHWAMQKIHETERDEAPPPRPRRFLVDPHAGGAYSYYRDHHAVARELHRDFIQERYRRSRPYQPTEEAIDRHARRGFWLLACRAQVAEDLRRYALRRCPGADQVHDFRHGGFLLRCPPGAEPRRPRRR